MNKKDVLKWFGNNGAEVARSLDIAPAAVYQWGDVVPEKQAARLDRLTKGKLKYKPEVYRQ